MQRYRVNYRLLIGLIVGSFVAAGASYLLWRFQVNRNATFLLAKAEAAEKEGDVEAVYKNLDQYVKLRPKEDEVRVRLGEAAATYVTEEDLESTKRNEVYQTLVSAVSNTDDADLRRKLVDLQVDFGAFAFALQNIDALLDVGRSDPKLKAMKARCLFETKQDGKGAAWCYRLVGYDPATDEFDVAQAEAPHEPMPYGYLAQHLFSNRKPELAERVLTQMIEVNPDSSEAYVFHYRFLKTSGKDEEAREALDKAYEIDPEDATVLTFMGSERIADFQKQYAAADASDDPEAEKEAAKEHLHAAAKILEKGLELFPDRIDFYEKAAQVEQMLDNREAALAVVDRALRKFPLKERLGRNDLPVAINLFNSKLDLLLFNREFDAAEKEIDKLRDLNNSRVTPIAAFYEARMAAINERWAEAASKLQATKPRLVHTPELQALAGAVQGFCHAQLGQYDLALEAYRWALNKNPNLPQAKMGEQEMLARRNPDEQQGAGSQLDQQVKEMLVRPVAQQDWAAVNEAIDAYIEEQAEAQSRSREWVEGRQKLFRGRVLAMRSEAADDSADKARLFTEAREHIEAAYESDPNDPGMQEQRVRLAAQDPDGGPAKAIELLDKIVVETKDAVNLRILRADLIVAMGGDDAASKLNEVTKGMDDWSENQRAMVWMALGNDYERLGNFPEALHAMEQAAELAPNSLPNRMALFDLGMKHADDVAMRNAQKKILEIVKDQDDPGYMLTEVKRRIVGYERGAVSEAELKEARKMLDAALRKRPTYADLHLASGQLWLILEKNPERALASFEEALQYGPANLSAVNLQVRLLADRGRFQEARQKMDRIPEQAWASMLDRVAAVVLQNVGETERAFEEAEKVAKARPKDDGTQVWFAQIASQLEQYEKAEEAYRRALEINPGNPDHWTGLVGVYLQLNKPEEVERALREAHLALDAEYLPLLSGKYLELHSRWQEAEDIYLSAYADRLDDPTVARRMAEFYLTWAGQSEANRGKANAYINRILKKIYAGDLPPDDPNAVWARQQGAKLLSLNNNYRDSLRAERLLDFEGVEGAVAQSDVDQLIDVLSRRGDPASRLRVVDLLRKVQQQRGLTSVRALHLGDALNNIGEWEAAKSQMQDAIEQYPSDVGLQTAMASMLISRKEFAEAEQLIDRLEDVDGAERPAAELKLRLAAAKGDKDAMRASLESITPDLRVLDEQQLAAVLSVAQLADSIGDHEYALKLMREYVRRSPGQQELELARLVSQHGPLDEGIEMLLRQFDGNMDAVVAMAVDMLRKRRSEAPEKLDAAVERIVRQALRDDPESARRLVSQAEMLEIQGNYDEGIAAYEKLLRRDDVPEIMRAAASNNLAYLLAINGRDLDRALEVANKAIEVIGPISDILDTRALVHAARGDFDKAVEDMQLAVKVGPTPGKYFHLAQVQLGAGDEKAALDAWDKAEAAGIAPESVSALEREKLEEVRKKIDALRTSTAQL